MKKLLSLLVLITSVSYLGAQTGDPVLLSPKLFLEFDFMKVKAENLTSYLEVEQFWSAIHEQRVKRGDMIGWDLWSLTPGGQAQGSQFLTVQVYPSFEKMIRSVDLNQIIADAKKAFPKKTPAEIDAMIQKTGKSREINNQLWIERIDYTNDKFDMPLGTVSTMAIMNQLKNNYEKAETEIFKPYHQKLVDAGKKGSWSIGRIMFPAGSDRYASHLVFNMFKDAAQFAKSMEEGMPEINFSEQQAVNAGLETRDMKEVKLLTLIRKVR